MAQSYYCLILVSANVNCFHHQLSIFTSLMADNSDGSAYCLRIDSVRRILRTYFTSEYGDDELINTAQILHKRLIPRVEQIRQGLATDLHSLCFEFEIRPNCNYGGVGRARKYSMLDLLLSKAGSFLEKGDLQTFEECVDVTRLLAKSSVVLSTFNWIPGDMVDMVDQQGKFSFWEPGLHGVGNVIAIMRAGFGEEVSSLLCEDRTRFLQHEVVSDFVYWMDSGSVARYCVKQLRLLGVTTRLAFAQTVSKLLMLREAALAGLQGKSVSSAHDDVDEVEYELEAVADTGLARANIAYSEREGEEFKLLTFQLALGSIEYKLQQLRAWHRSEAWLEYFLCRTLSAKLDIKSANNTVTFLLGVCSCSVCSAIVCTRFPEATQS